MPVLERECRIKSFTEDREGDGEGEVDYQSLRMQNRPSCQKTRSSFPSFQGFVLAKLLSKPVREWNEKTAKMEAR